MGSSHRLTCPVILLCTTVLRHGAHKIAYKNYDATFRPKTNWNIVSKIYIPSSSTIFWRRKNLLVNMTLRLTRRKIIAAGFSYGAATAALAAASAAAASCSTKSKATRISSTSPPINDKNQGTKVLVDGWFYIDVSESAGVEISNFHRKTCVSTLLWNWYTKTYTNNFFSKFGTICKQNRITKIMECYNETGKTSITLLLLSFYREYES